MRVVVHHPARTEEDGTQVPESVCAYRLGRIEDFVNPVTGETTSKDEVAAALLDQARDEYPGQQVKLEVLVHNGDGAEEDPYAGGSSRWVPHNEVPEGAVSPKGGAIASHELTAEQAAQIGGEVQ